MKSKTTVSLLAFLTLLVCALLITLFVFNNGESSASKLKDEGIQLISATLRSRSDEAAPSDQQKYIDHRFSRWHILEPHFFTSSTVITDSSSGVLLSKTTNNGMHILIHADGTSSFIKWAPEKLNTRLATDTIMQLTQALKIDRLSGKSYPQPDNSNCFKYDGSNKSPGLINALIVSQGLSLNSYTTDTQYRLLDPWGNPYQYVLGDFKNRDGRQNGESVDTNKPANLKDWNAHNQGKYPYVYSFGDGDETTPQKWIYIKDN